MERAGRGRVGTVNSMFNNCNLAKIEQDLGEHWNEQVSLDINNCNLAKIYNDLGDQWNEQGVP